MENILTELRKPFHPSVITWKPGAVAHSGDKALAMAYADLRAYQDRLDEVCGLNWSVSYTPWGDRIICHLTITGITRSSTGEPDSQAERNEIAGTATEAQSFKRAAAMFGLGRYLYNLPSVWVEYNKEHRTFTDKGKARLDQLIAQHYQRESGTNQEQTSNQKEQDLPATPPPAKDDAGASLRKQFDELGQQLYGEQWEQVRRHNVERVTQGQVTDYAELSVEHISRLIDGLKSLQRTRAQKRKAA